MTAPAAPARHEAGPVHVLVTGTEGTGSASELIRHLERRAGEGAQIWVADARRTGLQAVRGWPSVTRFAARTADMAVILADAAAEMDRRYEHTGTAATEGGSPELVVAINDQPLLAELLSRQAEASGRHAPLHLAELLALGPPVGITVAMTTTSPAAADARRITGAAIRVIGDDAQSVFRELHLVGLALRAGLAHLTDAASGGPPAPGETAARYGWSRGPGGVLVPGGTWIGCVKGAGRRTYLFPDRVLQVIREIAAQYALSVATTREQLAAALAATGLLVRETEGGHPRLTVQRAFPGGERRRFWDLSASVLLDPDEGLPPE